MFYLFCQIVALCLEYELFYVSLVAGRLNKSGMVALLVIKGVG